MKKTEQLNRLITWIEQEGDSDGYPVTDVLEAFANLKHAFKIIRECDGDPSKYIQSTAQAVGDLSVLFQSINVDLAYLAGFNPTFHFREKYEEDPNDLLFQEIYQVNGVEQNCGKYIIYQHEISKKDRHPYAGRIIRLTEADWAKIFW